MVREVEIPRFVQHTISHGGTDIVREELETCLTQSCLYDTGAAQDLWEFMGRRENWRFLRRLNTEEVLDWTLKARQDLQSEGRGLGCLLSIFCASDSEFLQNTALIVPFAGSETLNTLSGSTITAKFS